MYVPCSKSGCKVAGVRLRSGRPCSGTCREEEGLLLPGPDKGIIPHQDNDDLGGDSTTEQSIHVCHAGTCD